MRTDATEITFGEGKVKYTITRAGELSARIGDIPVLSGNYRLTDCDGLFDASDTAVKVGTFRSGAVYPITRSACRTEQSYEGGILVSLAWKFSDEDVTITATVFNRSGRTIKYPGFGDVTVSWPATPSGFATGEWWNHWYTQYMGRRILSPSDWMRLRCSYLSGGGVGIGVCPLDLNDGKNFIWWEPIGDELLTYKKRWVRSIWDRPIPPGEPRKFGLTFRVSVNTDWKHLLKPYKDALPPAAYSGPADPRPIVQAGVEFDPSFVSILNPHGYNDDNGVTLWRRLDKPGSVPEYTKILDRAKAFGCRGLLWWQPGGLEPGQPFYKIDSHCVPPDVLPQYLAVNQYANSIGLEVGSMLRPAELQYRWSALTDLGFVYSELNEDTKKIVGHRIAIQKEGHDAGKMFYLDSFGLGNQDVKIAQWLLSVVGTDVPIYAEMGSDLLARYVGMYAHFAAAGFTLHHPTKTDAMMQRHFAAFHQAAKNHGKPIDYPVKAMTSVGGPMWYGGQLEVIQWLWPNVSVFAVDATWQPLAERLKWAKGLNASPVLLAHELPPIVAKPTQE